MTTTDQHTINTARQIRGWDSTQAIRDGLVAHDIDPGPRAEGSEWASALGFAQSVIAELLRIIDRQTGELDAYAAVSCYRGAVDA